MSNIFKIVLSVGAGIATGVVIGYQYAAYKLPKDIWKEALEAVDREVEYRMSRLETDEAEANRAGLYEETVEGLDYVRLVEEVAPEKPRRVNYAEYGKQASITEHTIDEPKVDNVFEDYGMEEDMLAAPDEIVDEVVVDLDLPDDVLLERESGDIFVITKEEFFEDSELGHSQITLIYYEGDKSLADDNDQHVSDVKNTVSRQNLARFGVGSGEDHVVYIRNLRLSADYEVIRQEGNFTDVLRDMQAVMDRTEPKGRPRKMRDDG